MTGNSLKLIVSKISRRNAPQIDGRIYLQGLLKPINIYRDNWGIPHIYAAKRHDLFFAQGFVHAQDRLWQMELNRRAAKGELSELFGKITLDTDRLSRTLGFARLAKDSLNHLSEQISDDVKAYIAGINAFLKSNPNLPIEFKIIRYKPVPWQVLDSIAYGRLQMWALTHGAMGELVQAELNKELGREKAAYLTLEYPSGNPVTLPDGIEINQSIDEVFFKTTTQFLGKGSMDGAGRGSNGWVIASHLSSIGHPILCNDMHLPLSTPSIWYYNHLHSEDGFHVTGFSQPGLPYVLVGHNEHIAWGATLAYTDCEDFFVENVNPETPDSYQFRSQWREMEVIEEKISIRGKKEHVERVRLTHHGPIINNVITTKYKTVSLSSIALKTITGFDGFAFLNEARHWEEFKTAVSKIESPSLNFLYADIEGNIGHYVSGKIPIRSFGDGTIPATGWTGEYEWIGEIPFDEMPHALNPKQGFIISANNRITGDDYPYFLGQVWRNGYRARRIEELISTQNIISLQDCERYQYDFYCIPGLELVNILSNVNPDTQDAAISLKLLRQWNGWLGPESVGGTVYEVLSTKLSQAILSPHLSLNLFHRLMGLGPHPIMAPVNEFQGYWSIILNRILHLKPLNWLPDHSALINRCLAETTIELRRFLGSDPDTWQWGRLHQVRFNHAMGLQRPLGMIFNQGPFPIGGDTDTIAQTGIRPDLPYENNAISISSRHIVDLGDFNNSRAMYAPGQSGQVGNPHYGDMIEPWLKGGYFKMLWEFSDVEAVCKHRLVLSPYLTPNQNSPHSK